MNCSVHDSIQFNTTTCFEKTKQLLARLSTYFFQVSIDLTLFTVETRKEMTILSVSMLPKVKGRYLNLQEGKLETTEKMYKHHVMQVVLNFEFTHFKS